MQIIFKTNNKCYVNIVVDISGLILLLIFFLINNAVKFYKNKISEINNLKSVIMCENIQKQKFSLNICYSNTFLLRFNSYSSTAIMDL